MSTASSSGRTCPLVPEGVPHRVLDGDRPPEVVVVPGRMRADHVLQHGDDRLAVDVLHPRVDRRDAEDGAGEVEPGAAPERVGPLGHHPDRRQPGGDEAGVEQAVVVGRLVEVVGGEQRRDRLEMRRLRHRGGELRHGEVADAEHPDVAVAPGLGRAPIRRGRGGRRRSCPSKKLQAPPEPPVPRALTIRWT